MIGKAASTKSFNNTIQYLFKEIKQAKVVFGNFAEAVSKDININLIVSQFNRLSKLNPKIEKPCYHLKFSPAFDDSLTEEVWSELCSELLDELDLKNNQAIAVLHRDTKYPNSDKIREHLHIVVNKIDYRSHSSSSKLYYDYYRIEQFLREFEVRKNLTKVDFDYDAIMQEPKLNVENPAHLGDLLKSLDELDEVAENIKTRERELNGIDFISYGLTSASSISKLAIALMPKAKNIEQQQILEDVVKAANEIPVSEIATHDQKLLVAQLQKQIAPKDIFAFGFQAQKLLQNRKDEIEKLPNKTKEESFKDFNSIFEKVKKYLDTIGEMIDSLPDDYGIGTDFNPQIELLATPQQKTVSIVIDKRELYRAQTNQDGKWLEQMDLLSDRERNHLDRLPQNAEEVTRELAARKLSSLVARQLSTNKRREFTWTVSTEEGKKIIYAFNFASKSRQGITIVAKNREDREVFKSEIANNGIVNVLRNEIPTAHLETFAKWQIEQKSNKNQINEINDKKQNPKIRR